MPKRKLHKSSKSRLKAGMYFRIKRRWKSDDVETIISFVMGILSAVLIIMFLVEISQKGITL